MKRPATVMDVLRATNPRPHDGPRPMPPEDLLARITASDPATCTPTRRRRFGRRSTGAVVVALVLLGGSAFAAAWGTGNLPGAAPPERMGVHFPGATGTYDVPIAALGGASPDSYTTLAEADGIVAAEQGGAAPGKRCVVIATASGAVTRGCWDGRLTPGGLVWARDDADGSQVVAFVTDTRAATGRVGQRAFPVPAGSDIAVTRLHEGEHLPIHIHHGTTDYTVSFTGGTATR